MVCKIYYCIFLYIVYCGVLLAQVPHNIPSPNSIAHTSIADTRSWTSFSNPAALGYYNNIELALAYENRFLIEELSTKSVQAAFPTKLINIAGSFSYFGYSLYHEMIAGVDFSRSFSNKFSLGLGFNYYSAYFTAANEYHGAFIPNIGLSVRFTPAFALGFSTFNPFQTNIKTEYVTKRLPSVYSLGTEYFFTPDFVWRTQIDREISSNYRFATGLEYEMLSFLTVKLGVYAYEHVVGCLGAGFKVGNFYAGLNCELEPVLGLNTQLGLRYSFR